VETVLRKLPTTLSYQHSNLPVGQFIITDNPFALDRLLDY